MDASAHLKYRRRRLAILASTLLAMLIFSLGCFVSYRHLRAERQVELRKEAEQVLLAFEEHTVRLFDSADAYLRALRAFQARHGFGEEWESLARQAQVPGSKLFSGIFTAIDRDGRLVFQSETPRRELKTLGNMSRLDHYQYFLTHPGDSIFIGASRIGKVTGKLQFRIGRPLLKNGAFDGLVYLALSPEHVTAFYRERSLGRNSTLTMLTQEPKLVARQPPAKPESYDRVISDLKATFGIDIDQETTGAVFGTGSPFDGFRRDVFYKKLADYPVTLIVGIAEQDLDQAMAGTRRDLIALAMSFALVSLVVGILVLRMTGQNRRLEEADAGLREFKAIVESTDDAIITKTLDGTITSWNGGAERLFGYAAAETVGQPMAILMPPDRRDEEPKILARISRGERVEHFETVRRHKDGRLIDIAATISPLLDGAGNVVGASKIARDISGRRRLEAEQKAVQQQLESQLAEISALHARLREQTIRDPLTGLYNRRYLDETMPRELALAKREGYSLAVVMLDLDHFKAVNDTYGHAAGDEVLKALSAILRENARESDMICRYGGEEFLVVLPRLAPDMATSRVETWRRKLRDTPVRFGDFAIGVTLSAGVAGFPRHGADIETLVRRADEALYHSKHEGRDRITCF